MAISDEDAQKRNLAFMMDHPAAYTAYVELAYQYEGDVGMHVVTQDTLAFWAGLDEDPSGLFELNDVLVRTLGTQQAIAIIKPDGSVHRLDQDQGE